MIRRGRINNLMDSLIQAIRINIFLKEQQISRDSNNLFSQFDMDVNTIFVKCPSEEKDASGKVKLVVSMSYLNGMVRGIWRKYDKNNDGFLQRQEFRQFFEDVFGSAGMKGTKIENDQLEHIYCKVDITNDGNISRLEMQKFLHDLFTEANEQQLDVHLEQMDED